MENWNFGNGNFPKFLIDTHFTICNINNAIIILGKQNYQTKILSEIFATTTATKNPKAIYRNNTLWSSAI